MDLEKKREFDLLLKSVPEWALAPVFTAMTRCEEVTKVLDATRAGLQVLAGEPFLYDDGHLAQLKPQEGTDELPFGMMGAFAKEEVARKFAMVNAHATVALWGYAETAIEDLGLAFLGNDVVLRGDDRVTKIEISLSAFMDMDEPERIRYLLIQYMRTNKADLKLGVGAFDSVLELVGLNGPLDDQVKRDLLELQQVRHVLLHKAGVADSRLQKHCPWLKCRLGESVFVSEEDLKKYNFSTIRLYRELVTRLMIRFGIPKDRATKAVREVTEWVFEKWGEKQEAPSKESGATAGKEPPKEV